MENTNRHIRIKEYNYNQKETRNHNPKGEHNMKKLFTANRETGDIIEEVKSIEAGRELISRYEAEDKAEGTYEENFYDVVDEDHNSVL